MSENSNEGHGIVPGGDSYKLIENRRVVQKKPRRKKGINWGDVISLLGLLVITVTMCIAISQVVQRPQGATPPNSLLQSQIQKIAQLEEIKDRAFLNALLQQELLLSESKYLSERGKTIEESRGKEQSPQTKVLNDHYWQMWQLDVRSYRRNVEVFDLYIRSQGFDRQEGVPVDKTPLKTKEHFPDFRDIVD
jgi:hypothetical protein